MDTDTGLDDSFKAVDDLLSMPVPGNRPGISVPASKEMDTGTYTTQFFMGADEQPVTPLERLGDAKVGLTIFIDEASKALGAPNDELTPDQRIHVATIVSYVEALAARLDKIRVPGFTQKRKTHRP
jgi:hypothetical protein